MRICRAVILEMGKGDTMGIYMDNAATTMQKPDCVIDAVVNAMSIWEIPAGEPMKRPWMPPG